MQTNTIAILVMHTKKGDTRGNIDPEMIKPTRQNIAGSMDILNMCANVLLFWRNKPKNVIIENLNNALEDVRAEKLRPIFDEKKLFSYKLTNEKLSEYATKNETTGEEDLSPYHLVIQQISNNISAFKGLPDNYLIVAKNRLRATQDFEIGLYYNADYFRWSEYLSHDNSRIYPELVEFEEDAQQTDFKSEYIEIQDDLVFYNIELEEDSDIPL